MGILRNVLCKSLCRLETVTWTKRLRTYLESFWKSNKINTFSIWTGKIIISKNLNHVFPTFCIVFWTGREWFWASEEAHLLFGL